MACRDEDLTARTIANIDALLGFDSGNGVASALDLQAQLHYAGHHATVSLENGLKPAKARPRDLIGGQIPDHAYTPSEVLGEEFVAPVLDAYKDYQKMVFEEVKVKQKSVSIHRFQQIENQIDSETLSDFRADSGLNDAIADARADIEDFFPDDADRASYAHAWLDEAISGRGKDRSQTGKIQEGAAGNLNKNLLLNNLHAGLLNWTQLTTTTIPEYGLRNFSEGTRLWRKAIKEKSPELETIGGERFYDESTKLDFFSMPEGMNQGITYYTAKAQALKNGASESGAKAAGNKAVEAYQFKFRPGNAPRAMWRGGAGSQLQLMSYAIQMRKLHHGWVKGLFNKKTMASSFKKLAYFYFANAALNGLSADIPTEVQLGIKAFDPKLYKQITSADEYSLFKGTGAEFASIPISPAGYAAKVPLMWDKVMDAGERFKRVSEHPGSVKNWVMAAKEAALFVKPVPVIGNKNAGNLAEYLYRTTMGDYKRYLPGTSKSYQSNKGEELQRLILGTPPERVKEAQQYRARK